MEQLAKLMQEQSTYDNTCKVTADTNYVLVEKTTGFVVGVQVIGSSEHTGVCDISVKFFGSDEEHIVSKSKAGIHGPWSYEGGQN